MIDPLVRTEFKEVDKRAPVSEVVGYLRGDAAALPIVTDRGRPWGILNERHLTKSAIPDNEHLERHTIGTKVLHRRASVRDAARIMLQSGIDVVPVAEDERTVGFVRALDLIPELGFPPVLARVAVKEVPVLLTTQSLGEALHHFHAVNVDHLPVLDASGKLYGFIPRKAVLTAATNRNRPAGRKVPGDLDGLLSMEVSGFTVDDWTPVGPEDDSDAALRVLERFGYAPVVENGSRFLGMITPVSLLAAVTRGRL
jgi:CBS domain-containing protein